MEVPYEVVEGWLLDLRKPEIHKYDRAVLIRRYIKNKQISQRELAKKLGIPKSTVEDWLLYDKLSKGEYQDLISQGFTCAEIYKRLRNNKATPIKEIFDMSLLDKELHKSIMKIRPLIRKVSPTQNTIQLMQDLRNILNKADMYFEMSHEKK